MPLEHNNTFMIDKKHRNAKMLEGEAETQQGIARSMDVTKDDDERTFRRASLDCRERACRHKETCI